MSKNILEKIIQKKILKIDNLKKTIRLNYLKDLIDKNDNFIDFKEKIEKNIDAKRISIIAEIKKASPSAGIIINEYNPLEIANARYILQNVERFSLDPLHVIEFPLK